MPIAKTKKSRNASIIRRKELARDCDYCKTVIYNDAGKNRVPKGKKSEHFKKHMKKCDDMCDDFIKLENDGFFTKNNTFIWEDIPKKKSVKKSVEPKKKCVMKKSKTTPKKKKNTLPISYAGKDGLEFGPLVTDTQRKAALKFFEKMFSKKN